MTKSDLKEGMLFKTRGGAINEFILDYSSSYNENLTSKFGASFDVMAVYPAPTEPIWERKEERKLQILIDGKIVHEEKLCE